MRRRDFMKLSLILGTGYMVGARPKPVFGAQPNAVWVTGGEPLALLHAAVDAYSGISNFISKGDRVVIKPNIGWDRKPEQAANTNPQLVAELVKMCFEAGAAEVKIFDRTCNNPQRCYKNSEIESLSKKYGAEVDQIRDFKFKEFALPEGEILKEWPIYQDYLDADKVINIPIAKHHSMSRVSLGLKNLMGVMGGNRGSIHNSFTAKINDISAHILPTLTIIDAYRILLRNGPSGGNVNDVKLEKALIMSPCTVTADYLALNLFDLNISEVPYIKEAIDRGLNKYDTQNLDVKRINLS
jgi:uncharacterized protein (DUF362 family)